ncbi:hypothetical protein [Chitinophaga qingshengii]|uniref:Uncharacterized protein n=1 Tax=Chitinophaga qingshengii TaxID=1569794 RepID=A0ABR7TMY9_9BACT|nr:hypothetical protein [Chitinophaga qingshengii]MBC9931851.1 hypothetical protein [Chitinophaga qingshengii]
MKKLVKYSLIFLGSVLLLLLLLIGGFWISSERKFRQAEEDGEKYSRLCDTIKVITEKPEIRFVGFKPREIGQLRFKILRGGQFIRDTLVKPRFNYSSTDSTYFTMSMPYDIFLKTDTVVATTAGGLQYYISGYHHYAYLHHGMMGYLGSHDCRFAEGCVINNEPSSGALVKNDGWLHPEKELLKKLIQPDTPAFDSVSANAAISYEKAGEIFQENRLDKQSASRITYRLELGEEGNFYVFGEEVNGHIDIVKINMQTGACERTKK